MVKFGGDELEAQRTFEAIRDSLVNPTIVHGGDVGSGKGEMEREQIRDMISKAQAESDTKLATAVGQFNLGVSELRADIREMKASTASKGTVIITGVSVVLGLGALLAAFLAFGSQWFGLGLDSSAAAEQAAQKAVAAYDAAHPTPTK